MQTKAEIKKGAGSIEDKLIEYTPQDPEERLEEKTTAEDVLNNLAEKYAKSLELLFWSRDLDTHLATTVTEILTPTQINAFLQTTITREKHKRYQENTGIFISRLIQNSYDAGNNDFILNTQNIKPLDHLGHKLKGRPENKIKIKIDGNTGDNCGWESKNSEYSITGNTGDYCGYKSEKAAFKIQGDAGDPLGGESKTCRYQIGGNTGDHCGLNSKHTTFNIRGNTKKFCGTHSTNCEYNIQGNTGDWCGVNSKNCEYNITGMTGDKCGKEAKHSTFNSDNPETLQKMVEDVPQGNRIIFMQPEGTEQTIRDYES